MKNYYIDYIDYTLEYGKAIEMSDCFDLKGYKSLIKDEEKGQIHINRVDVEDPMNATGYTCIYSNPLEN